MKKILYLIALLLLAACAEEEKLTHSIVYDNDFALTDNPDDAVQHERYLLYKEFGVPVYFNDTIVRKDKGTDRQGNPLYAYETVDLNWTFSGYNRSVTYKYHYLTDPQEQLNALAYVRQYLNTVSRPMRPFSIMLADTLTVSTASKTERPYYHVGFRTLVFAQIKNLTNKDTVAAQIQKVIKSMISDRIKANKDVCARFAHSATQKGWYYRDWNSLGNCPTIVEWQGKSWTLSVNELFNEPPYTPYNNENIVTRLTQERPGQSPYVATVAEAITIRQKMLDEMGNYGFIRGWKQTATYSPNDDGEDREYYVQAILHLGEKGFKKRYGNSKLVMEKYQILADFITNTLGVSLDYDGISAVEVTP